jgi:hypothetical protein
VDAPLVVDNASGQRECERQVGQRYGRWQVSANSTNEASRRLAGVTLRQLLETALPPAGRPTAQRAAACDELVRRLTRLASADPPLHLDSHPVTRQLVQCRLPRVWDRSERVSATVMGPPGCH